MLFFINFVIFILHLGQSKYSSPVFLCILAIFPFINFSLFIIVYIIFYQDPPAPPPPNPPPPNPPKPPPLLPLPLPPKIMIAPAAASKYLFLLLYLLSITANKGIKTIKTKKKNIKAERTFPLKS